MLRSNKTKHLISCSIYFTAVQVSRAIKAAIYFIAAFVSFFAHETSCIETYVGIK